MRKLRIFETVLMCSAVLGGAISMASCGSGSSDETPTYKLVIAGMTDTEERRLSIDFTDPYYTSELVLVVKTSAGLDGNKTYSESELSSYLSGKILVSQNGTVTNDMLDIFVDKFGAIKASAVDSFTTAAMQVSAGQAFAFTAELPVAQGYVNRSNGELMLIHIDENILGEENLASLSVSIGIKKGQEDFISSLNGVLDGVSTSERNEMMTEMVGFTETNDEATDNITSSIEGTNGTIVIGLECNYPSFNWTETSPNNYTYPILGQAGQYAEGYDVEIAKIIAKELNMTLQIQKMEWDALLVWAMA